MKKEEYIKRYCEEAYEKLLAQNRERNRKYLEEHKEQERVRKKKWQEEHPEEVKANSQELTRKGGKYYDRKLEYMRTGIQGDKNKIRIKHAKQYKPYKDIVAPESQIHHEWIPKTCKYRGVALVEANAHQYGIVDVIQILEGKIRLLTEEEVKNSDENQKVYKDIV